MQRIRAVWKSVVAGIVFEHDTIEWLRRELSRNAQLRQLCGFDVFGGGGAAPPAWVYTRFLKKVLAHLCLVEAMFDALVKDSSQRLPDLGQRLAIDSKALSSFGRPSKKDKEDGRRDLDAGRGTKTYRCPAAVRGVP
ncbi:unnamed protein product, partial [marine sediment metagenome]